MTDNFTFSPLPNLETRRLILRPLVLSDIEAIYEYSKSMAFGQCLKRKTPLTFEETQKFISGILKNDPVIYWGVLLKETHRLIGDCGFCQIRKDVGRIELCYAIDPVFWNHGYATESASRVIQFGFEHIGANRIQAICNTANGGSEKVIQKCGLKLEGVLRQYIQCDGEPLDMKMYSILKQEWVERQANPL